MTNQYKLYWLHESPGGALDGSYGATISGLDQLPINETLAGRIRALTPPGAENPAELFLPYLCLRDKREWATMQLSLPVAAASPSQIVVGDEREHPYAAILAGPRLGAPAVPVVFRDDREWNPVDWSSVVAPMLALHKLNPPEGWHPQGRFRVQWQIELAPEHSSAWINVPHRRDARFLDQLRGLSTSLQKALRTWLPYQYFHNPLRYAKTQFAHPYLVYGQLPPHPSRRKTQLTFHVLEPDRVVRSMARLGKLTAAQLRRVLVRLEAAGLQSLNELYQPEEAVKLVRSLYSLPRSFAALVAMESFVVEEFVRFASEAHDLRASALSVRTTVEPGLKLLHNLICRLARSYGGETYTHLTSLILAAASAGIVRLEAPHDALEARVAVSDLTTGDGFQLASRFSYASF